MSRSHSSPTRKVSHLLEKRQVPSFASDLSKQNKLHMTNGPKILRGPENDESSPLARGIPAEIEGWVT